MAWAGARCYACRRGGVDTHMVMLDDLIGTREPREKRMGPRRFFVIGVMLFVLKFVLDRAIATLAFGRPWSPLNYLIPNEAYALPAMPASERAFYLIMLAVALPFVWIGIVVTSRRLRDAGLSLWLLPLFFVPAVNLLFFAALSVLPSARPQPEAAAPRGIGEPSRPPLALQYGTDGERSGALCSMMPGSRLGSAQVAVFLTAPFAVGATLLGAEAMRDSGGG